MSAADQLVGVELKNGWVVTKHLARNPNGSGETFSQSYEAKLGNRVAFVKAFDFWQAFEPGVDTAEAIEVLIVAYNHERTVLEHCKDRRLSHVVHAVDHGSVNIPNMAAMEGRVFYLIFEKADGDVRCQMDMSRRLDTLWCMKALKDVSLGLWQVHKELIAHQDTKPSNVLTYNDNTFKIADFGRSSRVGHSIRHDNFAVAGDRSYAPPELLYGVLHPEFAPRRIGCDLYMLGNLAAFLFSGVNVTAHLLGHLDKQHHPSLWRGTYDEVLPYLARSFAQVLDDLRPMIDERVREDIIQIISELCSPSLAMRGHPKGMGTGRQYSLERYVTRLELLSKRLQIGARKQAA